MDPAATLKRPATGLVPLLVLVLVLLASLKLMSDATANSATFGRLYSLLLLVNAAVLVALAGLILFNLYRLLRQLRSGVVGARLTARMMVMFAVLSVTPVLVVYYFSLQFLHRGIDSWFDVRVERALQDALELSRASLDLRMRETLKQTEQIGEGLGRIPNDGLALGLSDLRLGTDASELTAISHQGHIIASSGTDTTDILPARPDDAILLQVRQSGKYIGLDPIPKVGLQIRVVVAVPDLTGRGETRILQALFPVAERMNELADGVQSAYTHYRELSYLRTPLIRSFTLTLSLVLLLSLLFALWAAFFSARRLAAPIRDLAEGTRKVAEGALETQLPGSGRDELGILVQSFNDMTRKLAVARDDARRSQQAVEAQRTYLEAVLARLSSGVVTFDHEQRLYTVNHAASQILGADLVPLLGRQLERIVEDHPHLSALTDVVAARLEANTADWSEEVSLFGPGGRQVLMCRGTPLTGLGEHVVLLDDVTKLIQAQRDAAWSEVARRLAHEIKNPLTPIRLSAERLRHKYLDKMPAKDRELMDRLTHTIVQQVEAMKEMVNAFSNYARTPRMRPSLLDLNQLVNDVLELYRYNNQASAIEAHLEADLPPLEADAGRLRQLVHNLVKNALEAPGDTRPRIVTVTTGCSREGLCRYLDLSIEDNGSGFPVEILEHAFEPYVTTKKKGSGLGLAIVKKIVEEHGGSVRVENRTAGDGAAVRLRLPAEPATSGAHAMHDPKEAS